MNPDYIKKVQDWVKLDNKILEVESQLTPLKDSIKQILEEHKDIYEKKTTIERDIIDYIQSNNMDMLTIKTSDGNIKFSKRTNTQPLSMKLLRGILQDYEEANPDISADDIIQFVSTKLDKKSNLSIKRQIS